MTTELERVPTVRRGGDAGGSDRARAAVGSAAGPHAVAGRRRRCRRYPATKALGGTSAPWRGPGSRATARTTCRALQTRLYLPQDMTVGPDGQLYVVDWNNHRIRVIEADGRMHIVAGIGELGPSVDDLLATDRLNHPTNVTFDPMGSPGADVHRGLAQQPGQDRRSDLGDGPFHQRFCGTGSAASAATAARPRRPTLNLPVAVVFDARRRPADRGSGEPDDPQGRPRDGHHPTHRRRRALRRRRQSRAVRAQRRRPGDRGRISLPDRSGRDARRADRARRRRQHLRRRHRALPRAEDRHRRGSSTRFAGTGDWGFGGRRRAGDRGAARPRWPTSPSAPTAASTSPTPTTAACAS